MVIEMTKNDGKQVGIRLSSRDLSILNEVMRRIIERSNGIAKPDLSSVFRELAQLRPSHYVIEADREYVRSVPQLDRKRKSVKSG